MPEHVTHTDRVRVFRAGKAQLRVVIYSPNQGPGRPRQAVPSDPEVVEAVAEAMRLEGMLWSFGGVPVFRFGARVVPHTTYEVAQAVLGRHIYFAASNARHPDWRSPGGAEPEAAHPTETWRRVCEANEWTPLVLTTPALPRCLLGGTYDIPEYIGTLAHPLVGDPPRGTFAARAPRVTAPSPKMGGPRETYRNLYALFAGLPCRPIGRLRLYAWLLYHLHARSLTSPSPLLFFDSWRPSLGKTEAATALEILFDGQQNPQRPPAAGDTDELIAHFLTDRRMAVLDNLDCSRPYQHAWLANLLTSRSAGGRAKFAREISSFRGRMVAMTGVYGAFSLHSDLRDRCWRVELCGRERTFFEGGERPSVLATTHRREILSEAYHLLSATDPWPGFNPAADRAPDAVELGMPAAARLLGLTRGDVEAALLEHAADAMAFDPDFVRAVAHVDTGAADLYDGRPLPSRRAAEFEGVSARGWIAVRDGERCILEES